MKINNSELFDQFFDKASNRDIKYLVLHDIKAPTFTLAIEELKKHQVSAHYIIDLEGEIFQLVEEQNIAYHAGYSYWREEEALNKSSIGIEFYNPCPAEQKFTSKQIESGITLCQDIIKRHNIEPSNIVGHSDIAYFPDTGFLNRKQDPSHLFPWKDFYNSGIGVWSNIEIDVNMKVGDSGGAIQLLKEHLKDFGYKIENVNDVFDEEFKSVVTVFNRRFGSCRNG